MKKYLFLSVLFVLLLSYLVFKKESYAFEDCAYKHIYPSRLSTLNLNDYLEIMNYREVYSFCSYHRCYDLKESNIKQSINNFKQIYDKSLSENEFYEYYVKGYPITDILVNAC